MSKKRLFIVSFLLTAGVLSAVIYFRRPEKPGPPPKLVQISDGVYVTSQVKPGNLRDLRWKIRTLIDLRPDGEAAGQPSASEMETAAKKLGMRFHYIPVPHERIPESAVEALNKALTGEPAPAVLYCRTGRRAVKTFALVKASQPDGPDTDAILRMVHDAGFSADELRDEITARISNRTLPPPPK